MGILQGLIAWLRKSAGKIVQAIFGWAVRALFGTPEESEKPMLSAVVAGAAAWPLLLIGIPFPKIAAFVIAFVPIPKWVASGWIRAIWIVLAAAVPVAVGIALASRGAERQRRGAWSTALHGFPVTAALSMAFLTAFLTSPIRRIVAAAKRREDVTIPLLLGRDQYAAAAETIRSTLEEHELPARRAKPPWLLTAPSRVLRALGGSMLRDRIPRELCFYRGESIDVVVNPNGVTLQAEKETAARAHALICEMATLGPGLQTVDSDAQRIERSLKDVCQVFMRDPASHTGSAVLLERLDEIGQELEHTHLPYDDWQVLYREILQMARAIRGRPQILGTERRDPMEEERKPREAWPPRPARGITSMSTPQLVAGLTTQMRELARKEVELAKAELRVDLKAEAKSVTWFAAAAITGLCFVNMLFVAAALLVARWLDPPIAALAVAGLLLVLGVIFGLAGKASLVKPMETTRRTLNESWSWAKNRIA
ncbi:MAG TPA: phage holin family protein [Thermoanaerobaculia bacterium]|nr:phage holin family protein [Thermoanaerobaculia bacterium]